jgi:hypothetical protein
LLQAAALKKSPKATQDKIFLRFNFIGPLFVKGPTIRPTRLDKANRLPMNFD